MIHKREIATLVVATVAFVTGIGLIAADAGQKRATSIRQVPPEVLAIPTTDPPTTTTTVATTTTTAKQRASRNETKPLRLVTTTTAAPEIGTATSIVAEPRKTPLEIAQGEVGQPSLLAVDGFWCALWISHLAEEAGLENFEQNDSPAHLHTNAVNDGRITDTPSPGYLVFIDLLGQNNANDYISHVGIVESVDGDTIHTVEGNADDSGVVTRQQRRVGDGFVVSFAPFVKEKA